MEPEAISEVEYNAAMARIEEIFHAVPGTREGDELDRLVTLVERYEEGLFPMVIAEPRRQRFN